MYGFKVFVFDGENTARKAFDTLEEATTVYAWIDDVAEVSRNKHGSIRIHSTWAQDDGDVGADAGFGAVTGGMIGMLSGPGGGRWPLTNSDWSDFSLYLMRLKNGVWSEPMAAPFLGTDSSALTACLSFDGDTALFTAARPSYPPCDVWTSERGDAGWSEPVKLGAPISSDADEFEVAISRTGTIYFSSSRDGGHGDLDIYRARPVDGEYPEVENLGPTINTSSGDDLPYIAPDESYLIFASDRPEGLGNRDLYISFQVAGSWTEPRNLGRPINSEAWEIYPSISPDGRSS